MSHKSVLQSDESVARECPTAFSKSVSYTSVKKCLGDCFRVRVAFGFVGILYVLLGVGILVDPFRRSPKKKPEVAKQIQTSFVRHSQSHTTSKLQDPPNAKRRIAPCSVNIHRISAMESDMLIN